MYNGKMSKIVLTATLLTITIVKGSTSTTPSVVSIKDYSRPDIQDRALKINNQSDPKSSNSHKIRTEKFTISSLFKNILTCVLALDSSCILDHIDNLVKRANDNLLREADADANRLAKATGRAQEKPSTLISYAITIIRRFPKLLRDGAVEIFGSEDTESETKALGTKKCRRGKTCLTNKSNDNKNGEIVVHRKTGRVARKGEKKQRLKWLIKLIIGGVVAQAVIMLILKIIAAKVQVKFALVAAGNLLISFIRLWLDVKKAKQEHPHKVIYYEHAQHQHHYDGHEGHDDWHTGPDPSGGETYWARTYDKALNRLSPQDLAYAKYAPEGTIYSKVDDKPNISWNPWA